MFCDTSYLQLYSSEQNLNLLESEVEIFFPTVIYFILVFFGCNLLLGTKLEES